MACKQNYVIKSNNSFNEIRQLIIFSIIKERSLRKKCCILTGNHGPLSPSLGHGLILKFFQTHKIKWKYDWGRKQNYI